MNKDSNNQLPRASIEYNDRQEFMRMFRLSQECEWLTNYPKQLEELIHSCESRYEHSMVIDLIEKILFIHAQNFPSEIKNLSDQIITGWGLKPENTVIAAMTNDREADSAQVVLYQLKHDLAYAEGWTDKNLINSLPEACYEVIKDGYNLVVIDEFAGTGDTAEKRRKLVDKITRSKGIKLNSVRCIFIAAMKFSSQRLNDFYDDVYATYWLDKGISESMPESQRGIATASMERLESELAPRIGNRQLKSHKFGYKRSEALYAREASNIPNNVFPIFWWSKDIDNQSRNTFFKRI